MRRDDYQATLIVMLGLGVASLTGLLRHAAIAHQLGASRATDIYLVAFAVPEFVFVALPIVLSPAFLLLFAERRLRAGEACAWRFGIQAAGMLLTALLALAALASLGAPIYLTWLAPGFTETEMNQAIQATRLMLPSIVLLGLATLAGAALQVYRRFARPALATAVLNLAFVATLLIGPAVSFRCPKDPVVWAAWGITIGAGAAFLFQASLLWRHRPRPLVLRSRGTAQEDSPRLAGLNQMVRLAGPLAAGYAAHHVILFADRAMATSLGAGKPAALNYAYHLALTVGQISGLAVSTAIFPRLAEQAANGDTPGVRASVAGALWFVVLVGLPATCGLVLLRDPAVQLLFKRGAFEAQATAAVSGPLVWYAIAVLADALCQPLWRVVYAQHRPWTVLGVNSLQTGVRLAANLVLIPILGYNGIALSATIGLSMQAVVLGWWVWRRIGRYLTRAWWRRVAWAMVATIVASGTVSLLVAQLSAVPALVMLVSGGALGGVVYLAVLIISAALSRRHTSPGSCRPGSAGPGSRAAVGRLSGRNGSHPLGALWDLLCLSEWNNEPGAGIGTDTNN